MQARRRVCPTNEKTVASGPNKSGLCWTSETRRLHNSQAICLLPLMRVLFLENHDSFSWNVIDALPVDRPQITIVTSTHSDGIGNIGTAISTEVPSRLQAEPVEASLSTQSNRPFDKLRVKSIGRGIAKTSRMSIRLEDYDCLIIGPGPTDPIRAGLIDIVKQAAALKMPTLGICLGHQAIGLAFGAQLLRTHPVHGKRSEITFSNSRLFPHTDGTRSVMRYHSLSLADVRSPLRVIGHTNDDIPMAIEHESLPIAGLQFHPDSYATERGREMLADFFEAIK